MTDRASEYSAADPALGYLYQVRLALLWTLRRMRNEPSFFVSIETLDDVAFEGIGGDATDLLQTKHHFRSAAALTDASPELWKTLRIWFEGDADGSIPASSSLWLLTTGLASEGNAPFYLRPHTRDVSAALSLLNTTADTSSNQQNAAAYKRYRETDIPHRERILQRISVLDAAPNILDVEGELRHEIFWAVEKDHTDAFLERLEGWWFRRVLRQLTSTNLEGIASAELESQMADLRESFGRQSLPIDDDLLEFTLDDALREVHDGYLFVQQLDLVKAGKQRIASAFRDYYRAFEQRSRWIRDELLIGLDLQKYEARLVEEWDLVFQAMRDELGGDAADEAKEIAARSVLQWAERSSIHIRPSVTEPFVCRGSLHMLADELRVGWHPDFYDRLAKLLGGGKEAA
jgi:hypothetical protein